MDWKGDIDIELGRGGESAFFHIVPKIRFAPLYYYGDARGVGIKALPVLASG